MTEERYPGEWARMSLGALTHLMHKAWRPGHPEIHYSCGDSEDPDIRSNESIAACVVGGDMLDVDVEWGAHGAFLWVGFSDQGGKLEHWNWASDPEDQDENTQSWDNLDYAVDLIHGWLERHKGPHKYTRSLSNVFGKSSNTERPLEQEAQ